MANQFEQFSESLLIGSSGVASCQIEVNFGQVHTNSFWNIIFKKFCGKLQAYSITFSSACRLELISINWVNVERDPELAIVLKAPNWVKVSVHDGFNFVHLV